VRRAASGSMLRTAHQGKKQRKSDSVC